MELYEIVHKLIGPITPVGDSTLDEVNYKNLETLTLLVDILVSDIKYIATYKDSHEYSVSRAGKLAEKLLREIRGEYKQTKNRIYLA